MLPLRRRSRRLCPWGPGADGLAVFVVVAVVVVLVVAATAGPSSPGDVVFGAGRARVEVGARQACDVQVTDSVRPRGRRRPAGPAGHPTDRDRPQEVVSTPWRIASPSVTPPGRSSRAAAPSSRPAPPRCHARPARRGGSARNGQGPAVRCAHEPGTERPRVRDAGHLGTQRRQQMTQGNPSPGPATAHRVISPASPGCAA